jgi:hypothetical protein
MARLGDSIRQVLFILRVAELLGAVISLADAVKAL